MDNITRLTRCFSSLTGSVASFINRTVETCRRPDGHSGYSSDEETMSDSTDFSDRLIEQEAAIHQDPSTVNTSGLRQRHPAVPTFQNQPAQLHREFQLLQENGSPESKLIFINDLMILLNGINGSSESSLTVTRDLMMIVNGVSVVTADPTLFVEANLKTFKPGLEVPPQDIISTPKPNQRKSPWIHIFQNQQNTQLRQALELLSDSDFLKSKLIIINGLMLLVNGISTFKVHPSATANFRFFGLTFTPDPND